MNRETVNQPNWVPTNKLMVASLIGPAVTEVWANMAPVAFSGPAVNALVGSAISFLVGYYLVRDRDNTPN